MKLTSDKAYELLIKDVENTEARYILHSKYVAEACKRIADKLGLDTEKGMVLGYLHDIGRKVDTNNHIISGYHYLIEQNYEDYAFICLTHSFLNNDIDCAATRYIKEDEHYDFLSNYIKEYEYTTYDDIVQLSDLICMSDGFTTIEKRLIDVILRYGVYENIVYYIKYVYKLKENIEEQLGCSIYDLFPEMNI